MGKQQKSIRQLTAKRYSKAILGFTLVEMVVVAGMIALVSVVLTQVVFTAARSNSKVDLMDGIKAEGDFALDRMSRVIRGASSVTSACNSSAVTSGPSITVRNITGTTVKYTCDSSSAPFRIKIEDSSVGGFDYLTSSSYSIVDCTAVFSCIQTNTMPVQTTVNIAFTLRQKNASATVAQASSVDFSSEIRLRNTQ